jgi:GNAT superfamily N-acetyltransferase
MENTEHKNLIIREATKSDIPIIFALIKELAEYEKLLPEVTASEKILEENLFGNKKYAEVFIAEFNGEIAGQALFFHNFSTFLGKPGIYLEDIYVRPQFRKKGIGKALLLEIVKTAKKRNCGRVEWAVLKWNEPSINFYKSLGAFPMNEWTIFRLTQKEIDNLV